jgi:hypothetical protein
MEPEVTARCSREPCISLRIKVEDFYVFWVWGFPRRGTEEIFPLWYDVLYSGKSQLTFGTHRLHLQGRRISQARHQHRIELACCLLHAVFLLRLRGYGIHGVIYLRKKNSLLFCICIEIADLYCHDLGVRDLVDGFWIGWLGLLYLYTQIGTTSNTELSLIYTLNSSPLHTCQ